MSSGEEGEVWPVKAVALCLGLACCVWVRYGKAVEAWAGLMCFGWVSQASRGGSGLVCNGELRSGAVG